MRTIEQIRADWDLVEDESADWGPIELAEERLYNDIPDLLAALAAKDAEIEQLQEEIGETSEFHSQSLRNTWVDIKNLQCRLDDVKRENDAVMARHSTTEEQRQ